MYSLLLTSGGSDRGIHHDAFATSLPEEHSRGGTSAVSIHCINHDTFATRLAEEHAGGGARASADQQAHGDIDFAVVAVG